MDSMIGAYAWEGDQGIIIFFGPEGRLTAGAPWSEWEDFEKQIKEAPLDVLNMLAKTIHVPGNVDVPIHLANFGEFLRVIPEVLDAIRQERARGLISYFGTMVAIAEHESLISIQGMAPWESPSVPLIWSSQKGQSSGFLF